MIKGIRTGRKKMMSVERTVKAVKGKVTGIKEWLKRLNAIKIVAIIAVNSLLLTSVYGQAVAGLLENQRVTEEIKEDFDEYEMS